MLKLNVISASVPDKNFEVELNLNNIIFFRKHDVFKPRFSGVIRDATYICIEKSIGFPEEVSNTNICATELNIFDLSLTQDFVDMKSVEGKDWRINKNHIAFKMKEADGSTQIIFSDGQAEWFK